jgi:dipeptidyl aminopeptidase/acylaminoacyl peptidase
MKRLITLVGFLALYGGVGFGQAAAKRPMTFADLMAMKRVSDPQISPSGKWVLFSVTEVSLEKNSKVNHLWVVPLNVEPMSQKRDMGHPASAQERQVTFGDGESNGRFAPDGKVLYLDEKDGRSQLLMGRWSEDAGKILDVNGVRGLENADVDSAIWSPDSQSILFAMKVYPECSDLPSWQEEDACDRRKDEAAAASPVKAQLFTHLLYRHWNAFTGEKRSHVFVTSPTATHPVVIRDLTPRSAVGDAETPTFSLGGPLGYAWAPDSKEIAYVTNLDPVPAASTNNDVFALRLDEAGAKAVKVSTSLGSDDGPQYSPDGKWLAFRSQKRAGYESDRFRLMLFERQAKTTNELMPTFDRWVDEFVWGAYRDRFQSGDQIFFVSEEYGSARIFHVREDGSELRQLNDSGEYGDLQIAPGGSVLVASRMSMTAPTELRAVDLESIGQVRDRFRMSKYPQRILPSDTKAIWEIDTERTLTHLNDATLAVIDIDSDAYEKGSFWFSGAEQRRVQGFIVRPPNFDPKKKYPVKFLIHGGPQGAWGDAWSYRWNPELMAASGYVVVMVNPRGSTGYGQAFIDGVNGDWGGKAYVDLMKGLDAAEQQFPFIDKDRECALGASYGGYMADWILTHTNRFKCIVTHDGMYNPAAAYGDTDELWFNEWEFRRPGDDKPGQPWRYASGLEADDPFRKWSPMLHIQDAKTPTLVIHSQRDYRLDVSEGYQLFTALQRLGVPSEMLYFPEEGHWVLKPRNSELWYKTVGDWCDRWVGKEGLTPMKH